MFQFLKVWFDERGPSKALGGFTCSLVFGIHASLSLVLLVIGTLIVSVGGELAALTPSDGLVGSWAFEGNVADSTTNANNGVLNGGAVIGTGQTGQGLVLSGTGNSHVAIANSASLNTVNTALTVSSWIKPTATPSGLAVVASRQFGTATNDQFVFGLSGTTLALYLNTANGGNQGFFGPSITIGQWSHIAFTYDGANIRFFVNGLLAATQARTGTIAVTDKPLLIGGGANTSTANTAEELFVGTIDTACIHNRALGAAEIATQNTCPAGSAGTTTTTSAATTTAAATTTTSTTTTTAAVTTTTSATTTTSVPPVSVAGLVGSWAFDGNVADSTANANNGQLNGGAVFGAGKTGQGVVLNGAGNSHVAIPNSASLNTITAQMSVSGWVKPTTNSAFTAIVARQLGTGSNDQFVLGTQGGNLQIYFNTTANGTQGHTGGPVPVGQWTHIAATYDGSNLRLYTNGTQTGIQGRSGTIVVSDRPLLIGGGANTSTANTAEELFNGSIDTICVHSRALTAAEVATQNTCSTTTPVTTTTTTSPATTSTTTSPATTSTSTSTTSPAATTTIAAGSGQAVFADSYVNGWSAGTGHSVESSGGNPGAYLSRIATPAWEGIKVGRATAVTAAFTTMSFDVKSTVPVAVGIYAPTATNNPTTRQVPASANWTRYTCAFPALQTSWAWMNFNIYAAGTAGNFAIDNIQLGTGSQTVDTCQAGGPTGGTTTTTTTPATTTSTTTSPATTTTTTSSTSTTIAAAPGQIVFADSYVNGWSATAGHVVQATGGNPAAFLSRTSTPAYEGIGFSTGSPAGAFTTMSFDLKSTVPIALAIYADSGGTQPLGRQAPASANWTRYTCAFPALQTAWPWMGFKLYNVANPGDISVDNVQLGYGTQPINTCQAGGPTGGTTTTKVPVATTTSTTTTNPAATTTTSSTTTTTIASSPGQAVFANSYVNGWSAGPGHTVEASGGNPGAYLNRTGTPAWEGIKVGRDTSPSAAFTTLTFDVKSTVPVAVGIYAPTDTANPTSRQLPASPNWARYTCSFPAFQTSWAWTSFNIYAAGTAGNIAIDNLQLGFGTQTVDTCRVGEATGGPAPSVDLTVLSTSPLTFAPSYSSQPVVSSPTVSGQLTITGPAKPEARALRLDISASNPVTIKVETQDGTRSYADFTVAAGSTIHSIPFNSPLGADPIKISLTSTSSYTLRSVALFGRPFVAVTTNSVYQPNASVGVTISGVWDPGVTGRTFLRVQRSASQNSCSNCGDQVAVTGAGQTTFPNLAPGLWKAVLFTNNPGEVIGISPDFEILPDIATPTGSTITVYDDQLSEAFQDWSFAPHNLANTAPARGTRSISFEPDGEKGIKFHSPQIGATIRSLSVAVNGGPQGGQVLQVAVSGNNQHLTAQNFVAQPGWQTITLAFPTPVAAGLSIEVTVSGQTNSDQATAYVDDIVFSTVSTPTTTTTITPPTSTVTPTTATPTTVVPTTATPTTVLPTTTTRVTTTTIAPTTTVATTTTIAPTTLPPLTLPPVPPYPGTDRNLTGYSFYQSECLPDNPITYSGFSIPAEAWNAGNIRATGIGYFWSTITVRYSTAVVFGSDYIGYIRGTVSEYAATWSPAYSADVPPNRPLPKVPANSTVDSLTLSDILVCISDPSQSLQAYLHVPSTNGTPVTTTPPPPTLSPPTTVPGTPTTYPPVPTTTPGGGGGGSTPPPPFTSANNYLRSKARSSDPTQLSDVACLGSGPGSNQVGFAACNSGDANLRFSQIGANYKLIRGYGSTEQCLMISNNPSVVAFDAGTGGRAALLAEWRPCGDSVVSAGVFLDDQFSVQQYNGWYLIKPAANYAGWNNPCLRLWQTATPLVIQFSCEVADSFGTPGNNAEQYWAPAEKDWTPNPPTCTVNCPPQPTGAHLLDEGAPTPLERKSDLSCLKTTGLEVSIVPLGTTGCEIFTPTRAAGGWWLQTKEGCLSSQGFSVLITDCGPSSVWDDRPTDGDGITFPLRPVRNLQLVNFCLGGATVAALVPCQEGSSTQLWYDADRPMSPEFEAHVRSFCALIVACQTLEKGRPNAALFLKAKYELQGNGADGLSRDADRVLFELGDNASTIVARSLQRMIAKAVLYKVDSDLNGLYCSCNPNVSSATLSLSQNVDFAKRLWYNGLANDYWDREISTAEGYFFLQPNSPLRARNPNFAYPPAGYRPNDAYLSGVARWAFEFANQKPPVQNATAAALATGNYATQLGVLQPSNWWWEFVPGFNLAYSWRECQQIPKRSVFGQYSELLNPTCSIPLALSAIDTATLAVVVGKAFTGAAKTAWLGRMASIGRVAEFERVGILIEDLNATRRLSLSNKLQNFTTQARLDWEAGRLPLTPKQTIQNEAAKALGLADGSPLVRGNAIDSAVKREVLRSIDSDLKDLLATENFQYGPDFYDLSSHSWFDITTPGQWGAHIAKYGSSPTEFFGEGFFINTKI